VLSNMTSPIMRRDKAALRRELATLQQRHALRRRRIVEAYPQGGDSMRVLVDGRSLLNFCSNDYLGLARHPTLIAALRECALSFGVGSGAAHLLTGHCSAHHALEEELAAFTQRQRALLFSSGYMANLGAITALTTRHDTVLEDRLNHASLLDAAALSAATLRRYAHADVADAARSLDARTALLATDGVFSMDGDVAPLPALARLAAEHDAWLLVDDAHGLGVLGAQGGGCLQAAALDTEAVPLLMGTLGKAFGSFGAFIAGDADLIEYIMQRARSYIYTTALPPAVAAATRAALVLVQQESWRRERLLSLIGRFRAAAQAQHLVLAPSQTPIQPLIVGSAENALALSAALDEAGFWVAAIRPPTVPEGQARLRITLSALHTEAEVDALAERLGVAQRQLVQA